MSYRYLASHPSADLLLGLHVEAFYQAACDASVHVLVGKL